MAWTNNTIAQLIGAILAVYFVRALVTRLFAAARRYQPLVVQYAITLALVWSIDLALHVPFGTVPTRALLLYVAATILWLIVDSMLRNNPLQPFMPSRRSI